MQKITGIVAEYNPFHNGHKYQIDKIKENGGFVIAAMSGSFVQRGDTAVFDKHTRAKCAVMCGVDLVLELPCVYSLSTAQRFAHGAVSTLNSLGVVDELCFGSECGDTKLLENAVDILLNEPPVVSEKLRHFVSQGMSYPSARTKAFDGLISPDILTEPNNILALEYIRSLKLLNSTIRPTAIQRISAAYHDTEPNGNIASATAVRAVMYRGESVSALIPYSIGNIYSHQKKADRERLYPMLYYALRTLGTDGIKNIAGVSEGLENRIIKHIDTASSFSDLADAIKTKRYTLTRINRCLMCILLGITEKMTALPPQYVRVLALNKNGAEILAEVKKRCQLPIISKPSAFSHQSKIWERELFASDIYNAAAGEYTKNADMTKSPVFVK